MASLGKSCRIVSTQVICVYTCRPLRAAQQPGVLVIMYELCVCKSLHVDDVIVMN